LSWTFGAYWEGLDPAGKFVGENRAVANGGAKTLQF
jgi:hypothetical protein